MPLYQKLEDTIIEPAVLHKELEKLFREADKRYNSGMFSGDYIIFDLNNTVIVDMIKGLYYPQSPYRFNIIEPNLLGKIYEMFLTEQLTILDNGKIGLAQKKECLNSSVVTTPTEVQTGHNVLQRKERGLGNDREEAKGYFLEAMMSKDGEEHERAECVYIQIMNCSDDDE